MKVFATLLASTLATDGVETNSWPANRDAPHCGCQILIDTEKVAENQYINKTCSLSFDYPVTFSDSNVDPHFVSVASSFMVGRARNPGVASQFKFTGYEEVSNAAQLDILVFYEQADCFRAGMEVPESWDDVDQSTIWEYYNLTTAQTEALCNFELTCTDEYQGGVHLGNFNYDIARSVQTYTVPIYGLEKDETAAFTILDYDGQPNNCMNDKAHEGHGTTTGCSSNATTADGSYECSNNLVFSHDKDHNGLLEYFQFEPVSPTNNPECFALPISHIDDYQWQTPSPWDTQQAYADANPSPSP